MRAADAVAQDADPLSGISISQDIADIAIYTYLTGMKAVDEVLHFQRAEQKFIPDIFNAYCYAQ